MDEWLTARPAGVDGFSDSLLVGDVGADERDLLAQLSSECPRPVFGHVGDDQFLIDAADTDPADGRVSCRSERMTLAADGIGRADASAE